MSVTNTKPFQMNTSFLHSDYSTMNDYHTAYGNPIRLLDKNNKSVPNESWYASATYSKQAQNKYTKRGTGIYNIHYWLSDKTLLDVHAFRWWPLRITSRVYTNYLVGHLYPIHPIGEKVKRTAEIGGRYPKCWLTFWRQYWENSACFLDLVLSIHIKSKTFNLRFNLNTLHNIFLFFF